jgi:hypothetical protein
VYKDNFTEYRVKTDIVNFLCLFIVDYMGRCIEYMRAQLIERL